MQRDYDPRSGRPLVAGEDRIEALSDCELEVELSIAAADPVRREHRLDAVLLELSRRGRLAPAPAD